ncbi:MAG TPA: rhomboid family intramembrane serine protease [Vicinamibacteria bacterium]
MIIPVGDAPNGRGAAPATYALIALNVAIYVLVSLPLSGTRPDPRDPELREYVEVMSHATRGEVSPADLLQQTTAYDLFVFSHGYRPARPSLADLLFCMFLHGGFLHLAGNMLFLWIYGDNVEKRMGSLRYLFWYLATGAAATLFHAFFAATSEVPLVGASGAISGVLGFYFVWFPRNIVRLLFLIPPFLMQVFEVPARLVLGAYLFMDNLLPYLLSRGEGGVAHGAHIGGFVAGLAVAWIHNQRVLHKEPVLRPAPEPEPPALHEAIGNGRLGEAADTYFTLSPAEARDALSAEEAVEMARWLRRQGRSRDALVLLRRTVRDVHDGPGLADAYALAGLILLEDRRDPAAAYQYLLTALELSPDAATADEVRDALRRIDGSQARNVGRLHRPHPW